MLCTKREGSREIHRPGERRKIHDSVAAAAGRQSPNFELSCFELGMFPFFTLSKYLLFMFSIFLSLFRLPAFFTEFKSTNFRPRNKKRKK